MTENEDIIFFNKAKALCKAGCHSEALEYFDRAIKINPTCAEIYNEKGNTLLILSRVDDAISQYRKAIRIDEKNVDAWNNLGAALLLQSMYEESIKCFDNVTVLQPNNESAWITKGALLSTLHHFAEAIECFDKALEINPNSIDALNKRNETIKNLELVKQKEKKAIKKICLLGDCMVGKTSAIRRYVYGMFVDKYLPTIGAKITKKLTRVLGTEITLMLWDITGLEDFRTIHKTYYQGAHAGIVVCDITRKETIENIPKWVDGIFKYTGEIPLIFLCNKHDLNPRFDASIIKDLANDYNSKFLFTSAKTGENIERAFQTICEDIVYSR